MTELHAYDLIIKRGVICAELCISMISTLKVPGLPNLQILYFPKKGSDIPQQPPRAPREDTGCNQLSTDLWMKSILVQIPVLLLFLKVNVEICSFIDCFIREREEGREKDRERNIGVREKHRSVGSQTYPNQGQNLQPRYVIGLEIKPVPLRSARQHQTN